MVSLNSREPIRITQRTANFELSILIIDIIETIELGENNLQS